VELDLLEQFKDKIKTADQLQVILGKPPRTKKVVMCHGVFDVVHPGHIRHFLFAKSKAPTLVVSLTSDAHINKGTYRPHIPEELRAINLAALEIVDFVIIDHNETPLDNLKFIRPDLFAKGYEYSSDNTANLKTQQEVSVVESYGGEFIFTPGDFVFSSSRFIRDTPPNIRTEKLLLLMKQANLNFAKIKDSLNSFSDKHIHVVGDTIIDSYTRCSMIGGQTKTPTISVRFETQENLVGGAGIVAAHLRSAGAQVTLSTILGNDDNGRLAKEKFREWGINDLSIIDSNRPTVNKNAIVVGNYRLLKVDTVDNSPINDAQLENFIRDLGNSNSHATVFSDFRHGIFNKRTIEELCRAIPNGTLKIADSQVASRWGNILDFREFDLITPNEREARFALGDQDSGIRSLSSALFDKSSCKVLIMKLSDRGIITCTNANTSNLDNYFVMDSFADTVVDPVGAGDALLAYATLALLSTNNPTLASIVGNLAAACECEEDGNVPITPEHLLKKIEQIRKEVEFEV